MKTRDSLPTREKAIKDLFSDRPSTPLPGSFNASQLTGHYKNAGWGDVTFTEEQDPEDASKTILVGPRDQIAFRHTFVLEHITGDYWLLKAVMIGNSAYTNGFFRAKFVAGVDGEPTAMELDTGDGSDPGDGIINFTKID